MNKKITNIALALLLGIGFQAYSMNNEDFDEFDQLAEEFVQELEKKEQREKDAHEYKIIKEQELKKQKALNERLINAFTSYFNSDDYDPYTRLKIKKCIEDGADVNITGTVCDSRSGHDIKYTVSCFERSLNVVLSEKCILIPLMINYGVDVNYKNINNETPLFNVIANYYNRSYVHRSEKIKNDYKVMIKLLIAHGASCMPAHSFIQQNQELRDIFSNVDQIDKLKNSPKLLIQKLMSINLDEAYLWQRVLMQTQSLKEFNTFVQEFKNEIKEKLNVCIPTQTIKNSLIENYATPAIFYQLMKEGVIEVTDKRITDQPSKKRQLVLRDVLAQNNMINFNQNFDCKFLCDV